jgi:hypothetical protein
LEVIVAPVMASISLAFAAPPLTMAKTGLEAQSAC